jgi:phage virion morphogenesis protein
MAGTHLQVDTRGIERLARRIGKLASTQRGELLDAIGFEVENQTRRRIADEKRAPDGTPWPDWSPRYAQTRHGGHSMLQGEDDLLDSIQYLVRGDQVEVGSNLVYAAIHQFGGAEVGMPIPARPYLGLGPENDADLLAVVEDYLDQVLHA